MKEKQLFALGVGHFTPVLIDLAEQCGYEVVGLYHYNDDRTNEIDHGLTIYGSFKDLFASGNLENMNFLLTMGDNTIRSQMIEKISSMGGNIPTLIHPAAVISRFSKISSIGVYIDAFSQIQADTKIGEGTIIRTGVTICHTDSIGKYCFFAANVTIGAYTEVDDYVFVGQGALSISSKVKHIGEYAYIGARSLLTKDVAPHSFMCGSPARALKKV